MISWISANISCVGSGTSDVLEVFVRSNQCSTSQFSLSGFACLFLTLFLHFTLPTLLMLDTKPHFMSFGSFWIPFTLPVLELDLSAAVVVGRWWWCT
jgi:hypothetical protein